MGVLFQNRIGGRFHTILSHAMGLCVLAIGITSADLAREIPGAICCPTLEAVTDALAQAARPGDLILTVGAGDIYTAGEALVRRR